MTEHSEQLTEAQKAAAFEWLRYLPERAFLQLTPRDLEQAERALRAWNQAENERDQFRERAEVMAVRMSATTVQFTEGGKLELLFDFGAHLERQRMWSERTFGPGARTAGVIDHIRKELREIAENPGDLEEWIDVVLLALDGAWRTGATPDSIIEALIGKQSKNEQREWPDWRTMPADQAIEHVPGDDTAAYYADDDLEWLEAMASTGLGDDTREAIINCVSRLRARMASAADREITGADVIDWADGVRGALGTEHASKVTAQEARIADAIVKAMPDPSESSCGQTSEITSQEMMAIGSTLRFVDLVVKPRRCDSDGVSGCWRCQTAYLASVVRRMLPEVEDHAY